MSQSLSQVIIHVVFSTKDHQPWLDSVIRPHMHAYIDNQEQHHRKHSFQEEYLELLRRYHVKFDEKYLWD